MKQHGIALLVVSIAVAGVLATGCRRSGEAANADYGATTPATDAAAAAAATPPGDMTDTTGTMATGPVLDTDFYQQALDGGRKEVAVATLASTSATDAGVKSLADMLVRDHTALNQQLMTAAGQADAAAPAPDATATADLQGKTGADFDRAFVDMMVASHRKGIALFENAAMNASTDQAKSLAQEALPKLRAHLQAGLDLQARLGGAMANPAT
jgi:putative membrane protein